jgi:hypothetical protein
MEASGLLFVSAERVAQRLELRLYGELSHGPSMVTADHDGLALRSVFLVRGRGGREVDALQGRVSIFGFARKNRICYLQSVAATLPPENIREAEHSYDATTGVDDQESGLLRFNHVRLGDREIVTVSGCDQVQRRYIAYVCLSAIQPFGAGANGQVAISDDSHQVPGCWIRNEQQSY